MLFESVMYYQQEKKYVSEAQIRNILSLAGIAFGMLLWKHNYILLLFASDHAWIYVNIV